MNIGVRGTISKYMTKCQTYPAENKMEDDDLFAYVLTRKCNFHIPYIITK